MRTTSPAEAPQSVLGRAIAVLEAFGAEETELGLAEISQRTGIAKATAHRIANHLAAAGLLERTGGGYRLGLRLFELGERVPQQRDLRRMAIPYMEDLYEASHAVVHLAVLDGTDVLYFAKISGRQSIALPTRIGGRMPAHATALGKALLAFSPDDALQRMLAAGLERRTPYTITVPQVLVDHLADVRRQGYAIEREEAVMGNWCAAAPVLDGGGRAVAAISVSGPANAVDPERLAPAVRMTALSLGRELAKAPVVLGLLPRRRPAGGAG